MAKDPRFNFYVDNWIGGTEGFTLEQEGAYLSLIIMQSKVGRFTKGQAMDKLLQKTRGDAAASARLWIFLLPKFSRENDLFWSERLENEMAKSKIHSEKQSERAKKRYNKNPAPAAAVPDSIGTGSGIGEEKLKEYDEWTNQIIDGNDNFFINMFRNEGLQPGDHVQHWVLDHRDLLNRYPKMRPPTQDAFRKSCIKHIRENYKKQINGTGTSKRDAETNARREAFAKRHSTGAG